MTIQGANRFIGLIDPDENQLNTGFYLQQVPAGGNSYTGFRTVIYLEPKRSR